MKTMRHIAIAVALAACGVTSANVGAADLLVPLKPEQFTVANTIDAVDLARHTITVNDRKYVISPNLRIRTDNTKFASPYALKPGRTVKDIKLSAENNVITEIWLAD